MLGPYRAQGKAGRNGARLRGCLFLVCNLAPFCRAPEPSWKSVCRHKICHWSSVATKQAQRARGRKGMVAARTPLVPYFSHVFSFSTSLACAPFPSFFSPATRLCLGAFAIPPRAHTHTAPAGLFRKKGPPEHTSRSRSPRAQPQSQRRRRLTEREKTGHGRATQEKKGARKEDKRQRQINRKREEGTATTASSYLFLSFFLLLRLKKSEGWDKAPRRTRDDSGNNNNPCSSTPALSGLDPSDNGGAAAACNASWWANCAPTRRPLRAWPCWTRWRRR